MTTMVRIGGESRCSETEAGEDVSPSLTDRLIVVSGSTVPSGAPTLLVGELPPGASEAQVLLRARKFPQGPGGEFWEAFPESGVIAQLEDLRRAGSASYLIVPSTAFAWLADRHGLIGHLQGHYRLLADDEACRIFDLRDSGIMRFLDAILAPDEPVMTLVGERANLTLGTRRVWRVQSPAQIEGIDLEDVRFLVVPDSAPWAPENSRVLQRLERRYQKVATRPGVCEMFDLSLVTQHPTGGRQRERPLVQRVFGRG